MEPENTLLSFYSDYSLPTRTNIECEKVIIDNRHDRFLIFIALCCKLDVLVLTSSWQPGLSNLGRGGTSVVSQGSGLDPSTSWAFKRLLSPACTTAEEKREFRQRAYYALVRELMVLTAADIKDHRNFIELEGVSFEVDDSSSESPYIWPVFIFRKADWSTLRSFVPLAELGGGIDMDIRIDLFVQIWSAIKYMHNELFSIHGDIKPDNILVFHENQEELVVKLADFGYSSSLMPGFEFMINVPISIPWYAPELKEDKEGFTVEGAKKTDMFSLGLLAMFILFGINWVSLDGDRSERLAGDSDSETFARWSQLVEEKKSCNGLVPLALDLLSQRTEIEDKDKRWISALFEKTLPCDPFERATSVAELIPNSALRFPGDDTPLDIHPAMVVNTPPQAPDVTEVVSQYYPYDVVDAEEEVIRDGWGRCVQLDATYLSEEFVTADYRVRKHLVECLEFQASQEGCTSCKEQSCLLLSVFFTLGFGCQQDSDQAKDWLLQSGRSETDVIAAIESIKNNEWSTLDELELNAEETEWHASRFPWQDMDAEHVFSKSADMAFQELKVEIMALGKYLGETHVILLDKKRSLLRMQELRGLWSDAEGTALDLIHVLSSVQRTGRLLWMLWQAEAAYAMCLHLKGKASEAEEVYLKVYRQSVATLGERHVITLYQLRDLCDFWLGNGDFEKVGHALGSIVMPSIDTQDLATLNEVYVRLALQLGQSCARQGRLEEAETLIVPAVEHFLEHYGKFHYNTLTPLQELVTLYIRLNRLDEAEEQALHLTSAWELLAFKAGEMPTPYPQALQRLAEVYSAQSELEKALHTIHKALEAHARLRQPELSLKVILLDVEVVVLSKMERREEALQKQQEVVQINRDNLGAHHRIARDAMIGLAAMHMFKEDYEVAEKILLDLLEKLHRDENMSKSNLFSCVQHLSRICQDQDRTVDAIRYAELTLACARDLQGKDEDVDIIAIASDLADLHTESGDFEQALPLRLEIFAIVEASSGEKSKDGINVMEELAGTYFDLQRYSEAEQYYKQALCACESVEVSKEVRARLLTSLTTTIEDEPDRADEVAQLEKQLELVNSAEDVDMDSSSE